VPDTKMTIQESPNEAFTESATESEQGACKVSKPSLPKTKIRYLDAARVARGLRAGIQRVIERHEHLNAINVFPVPDGDTGSNMAGTLKSMAQTTLEIPPKESVGTVMEAVADSALMGARGNSGAILAQFMRGFSESVKGLSRISPKQFAEAIENASKHAREAMSNPKEGTIISVIQDWAEHLKARALPYDDFVCLLRESLERLQISLNETKEKLAVLKAANVVDAGAQGFVYMIEGILEFTERGSLAKSSEIASSIIEEPTLLAHVHDGELAFGFCTECLIRGEALDRDALRAVLDALGDSVVVAGTAQCIRLHVHTDKPDEVFAFAASIGTIIEKKVEDMRAQHLAFVENQQALQAVQDGTFDSEQAQTIAQAVGIVTDSTCDLPPALLEAHGICVLPLHLTLDSEEFVDKVDISAAEFNKRLGSSKTARTSQPSPGMFKKAYEGMLEKHTKIVSLHVMNLYSGTCQSASAVSKYFDSCIHVLDSRTLSAGLGLVVLAAAERAKAGLPFEEVLASAKRDTDNVRVFVSMDTLDFAVRGGRVSRSFGYIAKLLNLKPVVEFASRFNGKVDVVGKGIGVRHSEARLAKILAQHTAGMKNLRFAIAHVSAPETAERYVEMIKETYGIEPLYVVEASAVLGIHSGPGACAVCFLGDKD